MERVASEMGYRKKGAKEKVSDVVKRRCRIVEGGVIAPKLLKNVEHALHSSKKIDKNKKKKERGSENFVF